MENFSLGLRIYIWFICFTFGSIFGSFIKCACDRHMEGRDWIKERSHCDSCGHELEVLDLFPIYSYLAFKGRCRYCTAEIGKENLYFEILLGLAFLLSTFIYPVYDLRYYFGLAYICLFAAISYIDLKIQEIPDGLTLSALIVSIIKFLAFNNFRGLVNGTISLVCIGAFVLVLSLIMDKILKKDSLGGGDIKLLGALAINFSLLENMLLLILACIFGLVMVVIRRNKMIPFGPAICAAALIFLYSEGGIVSYYLNMFL